MQVHDVKTTATTTLWVDSKNGTERRNPDTGVIINKDTNNIYFDMKHTQQSVVGIAISRVRVDARIPRLQLKERTIPIAVSATGGAPWTLETLTFPSYGPHSNNPGADPITNPGISGNLTEFVATFNNNNPGYDLDLVLPSTGGRMGYTSGTTNFVAFIDSAGARRLGFNNYPVTVNIGGTDYAITIPADNVSTVIADAPHDYRVPDLYLHIDMEVASEQGQRHQNIIYRMMINDRDIHAPAPDNDEVPAYLDDDRVVTPIELSNKFLPFNRFRLSWHYEDGTLADLGGAEWSLKMELISAVQTH